LQSLQSSLSAEEGLGAAFLSVLFAALTLLSVFLPPIIIKKLGCKWTIAASMCCYVHTNPYLCDPGLRRSTTLVCQMHLTSLLLALRMLTKQEKIQKTLSTNTLGSSFCQSSNQGEISEEDLECCGAYDCLTDATNSTGLERPSDSLIYTLVGVYAASGVLAVLLVIIFLDQIKSDQTETEKEKLMSSSFWSTFLATFRHLKDKRQCLLIPLTMYSGFEQAFLAGDYSKSFITCALGIHYIGYVMISFAGINSLCSLLFGNISQFTVLNTGCIITVLLWKPDPKQLAVFFVISGLWGVSDAVWQTQTNALYGILFEKNKEAAFANYRLWESVGFVIAFAYSTKLQVYIKTYIVLSVLVLSMVTYGAVEYLEAKSSPGTPAATKKENGGSHFQETH
ncbi:hypothetical protein DV515_00010716, partial [Chloebia gouldiae]